MKKLISLVLAALLLLSLCACSSGSGNNSGTNAATEPKASFMAGYGKVDITPENYGVPMNGYGNTDTRLSTGLGSYIYAIALAITDVEGNTAIMMAVDSCGVAASVCSDVRNWAKNKHDIPTENVIIASLHQHSSPESTAGNYQQQLTAGMKEAIDTALEDRAPAEMYFNWVETEALSFVRRYWLNDGGHVTSHSCTGDKSSGFARYESEADKEMRLVKFTREDKEDIIMVNFQGHPHMGTSSANTEIHSDWPGAMRDAVTEQLGVNCLYFSGAGGNMNSSSSCAEHNITQPKDDFRQHGKRAAEYVVKAEDSYVKGEPGLIVCREEQLTYDADHRLDHLLPQAVIINDCKSRDGIDAAKELLKQYPELNSHFQASAIVNKSKNGPTANSVMYVITCGDLAFTGHPHETFDTNGKELREGTVGNMNYALEDQLENPFTMTVVASIANGSLGYVPSAEGYKNGGYESDTTKFAEGTGELMVGDYLHALNDIYNAR